MDERLEKHMDSDDDNFYFMINPYFPTSEMIKKISLNLPHLLRYYPSNQKVISEKLQILEKINIPLIASNGSCEAIRIFLKGYTSKVLVTVPNFNEWEITDYVSVPYNASLEEISKAIEDFNVDTICLCNPNNPTGLYREDIQVLIDAFPNRRFVVDISFIDFVDEVIPEYPKGKNVILVKSLGKNYGICGIRLGYIASENEELIKSMIPQFPIWNINSIAEYLIDLIEESLVAYEQSRLRIIKGTQEMFALLKEFDYLKVYPTKANFVMARSEKKLPFNVKCCSNKTGLDENFFRFAYNPNFGMLRTLLGGVK